MARRRGRRSPGRTGCLFWLFILLVIVVVLVYRGRGNLRETISSLGNRITGERSGQVAVEERGRTSPPERTRDSGTGRDVSPGGESVPGRPEPGDEPGDAARQGSGTSDPDSDADTAVSGGTGSDAVDSDGSRVDRRIAGKDSSDPQPQLKDLAATIYFVKLDRESGSASPYPVRTTVQYVDSPITRTVRSLLKGPSATQRAQGIVSFIPDGTELISAHLSGGHLTLNFSSRFESNYSGRQAIMLQLSQIMLTAFEFSPVSSVSILIDGERRQYITGDGIPLLPVYTKDDLARITAG